jgi:cytochrome c oxidase subunit IV
MTTQEKHSSEMATYLIVYALIMILAIVQVIFAYQTGPQLPLMLMLAMIQATLAVLFFMHLSQERSTLILALIPAALFVLFMMNMIWSDSFRLLLMRPFPK